LKIQLFSILLISFHSTRYFTYVNLNRSEFNNHLYSTISTNMAIGNTLRDLWACIRHAIHNRHWPFVKMTWTIFRISMVSLNHNYPKIMERTQSINHFKCVNLPKNVWNWNSATKIPRFKSITPEFYWPSFIHQNSKSGLNESCSTIKSVGSYANLVKTLAM
jgi:hypothetical protein